MIVVTRPARAVSSGGSAGLEDYLPRGFVLMAVRWKLCASIGSPLGLGVSVGQLTSCRVNGLQRAWRRGCSAFADLTVDTLGSLHDEHMFSSALIS